MGGEAQDLALYHRVESIFKDRCLECHGSTKRKTEYRNLKGARVNVTYYPTVEKVGGFDLEVMNVVRIRKS